MAVIGKVEPEVRRASIAFDLTIKDRLLALVDGRLDEHQVPFDLGPGRTGVEAEVAAAIGHRYPPTTGHLAGCVDEHGQTSWLGGRRGVVAVRAGAGGSDERDRDAETAFRGGRPIHRCRADPVAWGAGVGHESGQGGDGRARQTVRRGVHRERDPRLGDVTDGGAAASLRVRLPAKRVAAESVKMADSFKVAEASPIVSPE